jgi:hypothetical protein
MADPKVSAAAGKQIYLAFRTRKPLAAYGKSEDIKEIIVDLVVTAAVVFGTVPEEEAVQMLRNCLRWVRGEAEMEPRSPDTLN